MKAAVMATDYQYILSILMFENTLSYSFQQLFKSMTGYKHQYPEIPIKCFFCDPKQLCVRVYFRLQLLTLDNMKGKKVERMYDPNLYS